jgi:solute carrier family 34 (sodium-dependent phosphate cotransporter)
MMAFRQVATVAKRVTDGNHPCPELLLNWKRIVMLLCALVLFVVGLQLIQSGASNLRFLIRDLLIHQNPIHTLGLGWLTSYLVLSGSSVATTSLSLLDSGALSKVQAFTMFVGSRFGAILTTLFLALLYYAQREQTKQGLAVGVLAFLTTFLLAFSSLLIGLLLLPAVDFQPRPIIFLDQGIDALFEPFVSSVILHLPTWAVITNGVAWLMLSFRIANFALPDPGDKNVGGRKVMTLRKPARMFLLGFGVTLVSPSASVSCGLLLPFCAKGYIGASQLVPYVMGANISMFSDSLSAAFLLSNTTALHVAVAETLSISIVSFMILLIGFWRFEGMVENWAHHFTESPKRFVQFLAVAFLVPLLLLIV